MRAAVACALLGVAALLRGATEAPAEEGGGGDPVARAPAINPVYAWRSGDRLREKRATGSGSFGPASEAVVDRGLDWLRRHQGPGGLWSSAGFPARCEGARCTGPGSDLFDVGVSGLALVAFLARGVPDGGPDGDAIGRGLGALVAAQDGDGCYGSRRTDHFTYNHSIALLAVAEGAALSGSPSLRASAERGLRFLESVRNPAAGWRYGVRPADSDTSVSAWACRAVVACEWLGLDVSREAVDGLVVHLDRVHTADGRVGYSEPGNGPARPAELQDVFPSELSEAMTAAGLLSRLWLDAEAVPDGRVTRGLDLVAALPPVGTPSGRTDQYFWHWAGLLLFQVGGDRWDEWQRAVVPFLERRQRAEGDGCSRGSWDLRDPWAAEGGRVYATAMAVMALEAPYAYTRFRLAPPARTTVVLTSTPPGAQVHLGARLLGWTPLVRGPVPTGTVEFRLVHPAHADSVARGEFRPLERTVVAAPPLPPGTRVDLSAQPAETVVLHEGRRLTKGATLRPGPARLLFLRRRFRAGLLTVEVPATGTFLVPIAVTEPAPEWPEAAVPDLPGPAGPRPAGLYAPPPRVTLREGRYFSDVDGAELVPVRVPPRAWDRETPPVDILMDRHEVTVDQYRRFARERKQPMPRQPSGSTGTHPVVGVAHDDARAYAEWAGRRLPRGEERGAAEAAVEPRTVPARGLPFPWGEFPAPGAAVVPVEGGKPGRGPGKVASSPEGVSADGCFDLVGNAAEWVAEGTLHGGGFLDGARTRSVRRGDAPPGDAGFRCVVDFR